LKKYLSASALANVTVCVKVMVQAACPEPVAVVLLVVPENVPTSVPDAAALPRLVVMFVRSVLIAAKTEIVLPATGAVLEVIVVPVCDPILELVLTKLAHDVAVTVPPTLTVLKAVCPHPNDAAPVLHTLFTFAPEVVDAKPL
jgi:hypothetical protein